MTQSFDRFCGPGFMGPMGIHGSENQINAAQYIIIRIGLAAFYAWVRAKHFGCHSVCHSVILEIHFEVIKLEHCVLCSH